MKLILDFYDPVFLLDTFTMKYIPNFLIVQIWNVLLRIMDDHGMKYLRVNPIDIINTGKRQTGSGNGTT